MLWQWVNLTDVSIYLALTLASLILKRNWIVELYLRLSAKTVLSMNIKRNKIMLQKRGTESCQIIKFARRGWITLMWIRTTSAVRENSRQTMNGYNGLWTEGLFVALAAELQKKNWERKQNNNKKNKFAIEKAKKQQQKRQVIPLSFITPPFSKVFFASIFNKYTATNDISNVCKSAGKHRNWFNKHIGKNYLSWYMDRWVW